MWWASFGWSALIAYQRTRAVGSDGVGLDDLQGDAHVSGKCVITAARDSTTAHGRLDDMESLLTRCAADAYVGR